MIEVLQPIRTPGSDLGAHQSRQKDHVTLRPQADAFRVRRPASWSQAGWIAIDEAVAGHGVGYWAKLASGAVCSLEVTPGGNSMIRMLRK